MGAMTGGGPIEFKPEEFPDFTRWQNAMLARPSVQKVMSIWQSKDIKSEGVQASWSWAINALWGLALLGVRVEKV